MVMLLSMLSKGKGIPRGLGNKVPQLAAAAIVFGYVLLLLAILMIEQSTARADALHADSSVPDQVVNQGLSPCEGSHMDSLLQGVLCERRPIVYGEVPFSEETPFFARNQGGDLVVWESNLTVGEASDSTITYLGYGSGISPQAGSIDVTAFEYDDVTYSVSVNEGL